MRGFSASADPTATAPPHVPALVLRSSGGDKPPVAMGGTAIERSMVTVGSIAIYLVKPIAVPASSKRLGQKSSSAFAVYAQNAITGRSWVVRRSYADFLMLRGLVVEHFKIFNDEFPQLRALVDELYFPRKHKFLGKLGRVVEHRRDAFLELLVRLHRLLISQDYLNRPDISVIGHSIFRGFLGSAIVQDPAHKAYSMHKPVTPNSLKPSERTPVNQCGSLHTVLEDDGEYEREPEAERATVCKEDIPREDSTGSTDVDSSLEDMTDGEDVEDDMRESEIVDRRRSYKYARNRKVLLFLKKDLFGETPQPVRSSVDDLAAEVVDCEGNAKALATLTIAGKE